MEAGSDNAYLRSLYQVASAVNAGIPPETVFGLVAENIATAFRASGCVLMLSTADRKLIHACSLRFDGSHATEDTQANDTDTLEVLATEPIRFSLAKDDAGGRHRPLEPGEGVAHATSIPIVHRGSRVGVVQLYTAGPHQLREADMDFIAATTALGCRSLGQQGVFDAPRQPGRTHV